MKSGKILVFMILILSLISFVGCKKQDDSVIKIGVFEPMTGAMEVEGAKLANELYPTVLGEKVVLAVADNKSDKVEAANAATMLVQKEKVKTIIGYVGEVYFQWLQVPIVSEAKVPAVRDSCTNPLVTKENDFYFRVCFIDPFQGTVMANYAFKEVKAKKAAIIKEISNDYSVGLAKFFTDSFKKLTNDEKSVVGEANYNTGDQDFTAQLTN